MTEILGIIGDSWVQFIVAGVLIGMCALGYNKGLVKMSVSFVSIVVSIVVTKLALPYVLVWVNQNEGVRNALTGRVNAMLGIGGGAEPALDQAQSGADVFYELIGVDRLTAYIGEKASEFVIMVLTFVVLLIVAHIAVRMLFQVLDLIAKLPGLSFLNRTLGGALGLIEGLFYIWIFLVVISILPETALTLNIAKQFGTEGSWLYYLKDANLLTRIFGAMLV